MYKKKTLFALSMVVCQWTFVSTNLVFTFGNKVPPEEVGRKDHRNTLLDFLDPRGILISPGDAKLRSKRRDITYFSPISSVKHTDALRLVFKTFFALIRATLRQGKPPLTPPFPKGGSCPPVSWIQPCLCILGFLARVTRPNPQRQASRYYTHPEERPRTGLKLVDAVRIILEC